MKASWTPLFLELRKPFRIARSTRDSVTTVALSIEHAGIQGYGEASPSPRYGESVEGTIEFFKKLDLSLFESPFLLEDILAYVNGLELGNHAAKCAVDIALHDWIGKAVGRPVHQILGLNPRKTAPSSYTIGIGSKQEIMEKLEEAKDYPVLKIKLGTEHDIETMETVRSLSDKMIYVDVNEGWKTRELACERMKWLEDFNIEFVEQPMPAGSLDDIRWLKERCSLPIFADEGIGRLNELAEVAAVYDGINIKIMKCTGLREAHRMITVAKALGLKVLLGCMIESSIGISAAAQLAPLVDYADLDGNILISNDPCDGVRNTGGLLALNHIPGIGIQWKNGKDGGLQVST